MMTIQEFCDKYGACYEGKSWAMENCKDMAEVWAKAKPEWLLWVATCPGVLPDKDLRLFACRCVRKVWHLLTDDRSKRAVEIAELFAEGKVTHQELTAAGDAARDAARAAAAAAGAAAAAAGAAARNSAMAAGSAALSAASAGASRADQALMLREYEPNFEEVKT